MLRCAEWWLVGFKLVRLVVVEQRSRAQHVGSGVWVMLLVLL